MSTSTSRNRGGRRASMAFRHQTAGLPFGYDGSPGASATSVTASSASESASDSDSQLSVSLHVQAAQQLQQQPPIAQRPHQRHRRPRGRAARLKSCCRRTIAFMCTQVGVGGLIVFYALLGAATFIQIETHANHTIQHNQRIAAVAAERAAVAHRLWTITERHNVFAVADRRWQRDVDAVLRAYQNAVAARLRSGYDARPVDQQWTFPAALMFCLSVFSMIGYGNLVPRTAWGKGATMVYATFGIPLYILYFLNIGRVLARTLRWAYTWVYACSADELDASEMDVGVMAAAAAGHGIDPTGKPRRRRVIVPSTACLWVMSVYITIGTLMFAHWENWNYGDAVYFCVTSLCKIGMGDFVPGTTSNQTISVLGYTIADRGDQQNQTKLVINFVYMLVGMALVAMCYNLMREDVRCKCKEMKEDMALCMEDVRARMARCFGGGGNRARASTRAMEAV